MSIKFRLFFKDYEGRIDMRTKRDFHQLTGYCLWTTLVLMYEDCIQVFAEKGKCVESYRIIGKFMPEPIACDLVHAIVKSCDSSVTLAEIEDAFAHSPVAPTKDCNSWPLVVFEIASNFVKQTQMMHLQKKKLLADSSD